MTEKIFMITWEYPPRMIGGLGEHVYHLSKELPASDKQIHVLTPATGAVLEHEAHGGLIIHRIPSLQLNTPDFITDVLQWNLQVLQSAIKLTEHTGVPDLIHVHDWLGALAGRSLKHLYKVPLVGTIHATEKGRHNGIHNTLQQYINDIEWMLGYEAWAVIVCSNYMLEEVQRNFSLPQDKIWVIANGVSMTPLWHKTIYEIDSEKILQETEQQGDALRHLAEQRRRYLLYLGRLTREKGVDTLLTAFSRLPQRLRDTLNLVIAGRGPEEHNLKRITYNLGLAHQVIFTGRVEEELKLGLLKGAEISVFPSLYEPFGIVALEAMAANSPVIASRTGGYTETIEHGRTGLLFNPGDSHDLNHKLMQLIDDSHLRERLRTEGRRMVEEEYRWSNIAKKTGRLYTSIINEAKDQQWIETEWPLQKNGTRLIGYS